MKLLIFFLLSFSPILLHGQIAKGTAKSDTTKEGLAYASVLILGAETGTLTDDNGYFEIDLSGEEKSDSLIVQYIGYLSKTISIKDLDKDATVYLTPRDHEIESIVVTPIDADSIMQVVRDRFIDNHFKDNQKQDGFSRSFFYNNNELFQVAETSYEAVYEKKEDDFERNTKVIKSRMVIDSAEYKNLNAIFNTKKETFVVEPMFFLDMGQSFDSGNKSNSRKTERVYELIDWYEHQGREVYEILQQSYRKDVLFRETTFIIDQETGGIFSRTFQTKDEEVANSLIPFAIRAIISVLGYKFRINSVDGFIYNRYNGEFFELDKGSFIFRADLAKGGEWVNGLLKQEFYLLDSEQVNTTNSIKSLNDTEIVSEFNTEYFSGLFHLPTTDRTIDKIDSIKEKNEKFVGDIQTDRQKKYNKKQEKKRLKKDEKSERKNN